LTRLNAIRLEENGRVQKSVDTIIATACGSFRPFLSALIIDLLPTRVASLSNAQLASRANFAVGSNPMLRSHTDIRTRGDDYEN